MPGKVNNLVRHKNNEISAIFTGAWRFNSTEKCRRKKNWQQEVKMSRLIFTKAKSRMIFRWKLMYEPVVPTILFTIVIRLWIVAYFYHCYLAFYFQCVKNMKRKLMSNMIRPPVELHLHPPFLLFLSWAAIKTKTLSEENPLLYCVSLIFVGFFFLIFTTL